MTVAVYVIASDAGPVKIGISSRVDKRLSDLQRSSAAALRLVDSVIPVDGFDAKSVERAAHKMLADCRMHGEWFATSPDRAVDCVRRAMTKTMVEEEAPYEPLGEIVSVEQYLAALKRLKLTPAGKATAAALGLTVRQCQRYAAGDQIPPTVALLLAMYLRHGLPAHDA